MVGAEMLLNTVEPVVKVAVLASPRAQARLLKVFLLIRRLHEVMEDVGLHSTIQPATQTDLTEDAALLMGMSRVSYES